MATVPSPGQCHLPPPLTCMHRQPWAQLTALPYPSEDFPAGHKAASKATGRSPWNLPSPSAFRESEFPSKNGQRAPQTTGHTTLPIPQQCCGSGANASLWKCHFSPAPGTLQIKSSKPRLGTQRSLSATRSLGKMNQTSHFQDIKIVYKSSQFLFSFE